MKKSNDICGIYYFTNKINNKIYVGQSVTIHNRKLGHLNALRNNKHSNVHLQRAFNKYGEECLIHSVGALCPKEYLDNMENKFIKLFNSSNRKFGYNIRTENNKFPIESKIKLSKALKNNSDVVKARVKMWLTRKRTKINQYDLNGVFIKTWNSTPEISKKLKISQSTIRKICTQSHGCYSLKGFMFREHNNSIDNIEPYNRYKKVKIVNKVKQVNCYDKITKELIKTYKNASIAAKELNIDSSCISKCCNGKIYYYKQYNFKYN